MGNPTPSAADPLVPHVRSDPLLGRLFAFISLSLLVGLVQTASLQALATQYVATSLATRFPRIDLQPSLSLSGMIVLGGQTSRIHEAMTLSQRFPDATVLLTGPGVKERQLAETHFENIIIEREAKNTFENALFSKALTNQDDEACWLLITSAIHMPRAVAVFRAAGIPVVPWPVFDTPLSVEKQKRPVAHEVVGLIAYRLLGRTREFYPAHDDESCRTGTRTDATVAFSATD